MIPKKKEKKTKQSCAIESCSLFPLSNGYCFKHQNEEVSVPVKEGFKNQTELFNYIWDTRPHVSEISGRELTAEKGSKLWYCYCLHILAKGKYGKYKLNPDNILLGHNEEHSLIDAGTEEQRKKYKEQYPNTNWNIFYEKQRKLKEEYK